MIKTKYKRTSVTEGFWDQTEMIWLELECFVNATRNQKIGRVFRVWVTVM